jgi:hypothetical protein
MQMTARVQDIKLIEPVVATRIAAMPILTPDGVERRNLTAPILQGELSDTSVLEDPHDPAKKYVVMGYVVAEEATTSGKRFAVRMLAKKQGWELSLTLTKLAPDAVMRANPGALELPHRVSLILRYKQMVNGVLATHGEMPFTSVTADGHVVRAVLTIETLARRDEIYQALTDKDFDATLIVRRVAKVAVPALPTMIPLRAASFSAGTMVAAAPTGLRLADNAVGIRATDIGVVIKPVDPGPKRPPVVEGAPPLFRQTDRVVDLRLKFTFDPTLHPYIFEGVGTIVPGTNVGLQRKQVSWNGRSHSYYQDGRSLNLFYFLPDTFKLARRPEAPHRPLLSAAFTSADGSREQLRVTVTYCAVPIVSRERLTAALPTLATMVPPEVLATAPIELEPLLPAADGMTVKLAYPGADTSGGPFAARPGAVVDLRAGVVDAVSSLTVEEFRGALDAICSEGQLLFTGSVGFQLGNIGEEIPFHVRLSDTAEPLVNWSQSVDGDTTDIVVKNPIESRLRLERLSAVTADALVPLQAAGVAMPLELPPMASAHFRLPRSAGTPLDLELSGVRALPDRETIFDLILDPSTRATYLREITVKTFAAMFAAPADAQKQVMAVVVLFDDGSAVELSATRLEAKVNVPVPIANFVLEKDLVRPYRYKVTTVRLSGATTDPEWRTDDSPILFLTLG